jgi:hypothetical protein
MVKSGSPCLIGGQRGGGGDRRDETREGKCCCAPERKKSKGGVGSRRLATVHEAVDRNVENGERWTLRTAISRCRQLCWAVGER